MGHRLTQIATRTGDDGSTGLGDGTRTQKDAPRIAALGDVDELNATLGVLLAEPLPDPVRADLIEIQHDLFDLGGTLCIPGHTGFTEAPTTRLDTRLTHYNQDLSRLAEFILPGGTRAAALAHVSRTVCRRAERSLVALAHAESVPKHLLPYLNRLSDFLFVVARILNKEAGCSDVLWQRNENQPPPL